jgi:mannosyltransferase
MGMEARSYAVSTLLAVTATLVLHETVSTGRGPRRRWPLLVGYGALVAVGVAVNIFLALLLVAHGITLLLLRGVTWRWRWGWLAASVAGLLLAVPIVWRATHQSGQLGAGGFGPASFVRGVVVTQWFLGDTPTPTTGGPGGDLSWATTWKVAAVALALLCWGLVVVALVAGRRRPLLVWTLPWVVAPTLLVGAYSTVVHDVYNPRYFSFAAPAIGLLVGAGLLALPRRWPRVVAAALVLVLLVPVYTSQRTRYAKSSTDWSGVAAFVAEHGHPGEGVYFSPRYPITGPVVGQTARGVRTAYPAAFAGLVDVTQLRTPVQDDNLTGSSRLLADSTATLGTVSAVWVVRRTDYRYAAADDRTLQAAGFAPGQRWQGPLDLVIEYRRS